MVRENLCENRLFSYHKADNAAFTTTLGFPPMFTLSDVKTNHLYSETAQQKVKTR